MYDNQIIQLIIKILIAGEANAGIQGTPIKQAFQPTRQGINTKPTAYIYKIADERVGTPARTEEWKPYVSNLITENGQILLTEDGQSITTTSGLPQYITTEDGIPLTDQYGNFITEETGSSDSYALVHTEIQQYATTFQLSALSTQSPATPNQLTASDLLNLMAYILQSTRAIEAFQCNNMGIQNIKSIRNPYFSSDRDQFQASPSFDFIITHKQVLSSVSKILESVDIQIYEI